MYPMVSEEISRLDNEQECQFVSHGSEESIEGWIHIMDKHILTTSDHFISKEESKQTSNSLKDSDARLVQNVLGIWLDSN